MEQRKLPIQTGIILGGILCVVWIGICIMHKTSPKLDEFIVQDYLREANNLIDAELEKREKESLQWAKSLPIYQEDSIYDIEKAYKRMDGFLLNHPDAQGIVLGLEMEITDHNGEFFPCSMRNGLQVFHDSLGAGKQDLLRHYQSDWYARTLTTQKERWSKTFQNEDVGFTHSFCIPMISTEGNIYGIAGVLYPVKPIQDKLLEISPSKIARICLADKDKTIIGGSQEDMLGETIFSLMEKEKWKFDIEKFDNLDWEKQGVLIYQCEEKERHLSFRTNEHSHLIIMLDAIY